MVWSVCGPPRNYCLRGYRRGGSGGWSGTEPYAPAARGLRARRLACLPWSGTHGTRGPGKRRQLAVAATLAVTGSRSAGSHRSAALVYGLDLQVWIGDDGEVIGRADFLWRRCNTIGEADGAFKYQTPARVCTRRGTCLARDRPARYLPAARFGLHPLERAPAAGWCASEIVHPRTRRRITRAQPGRGRIQVAFSRSALPPRRQPDSGRARLGEARRRRVSPSRRPTRHLPQTTCIRGRASGGSGGSPPAG